MEVYKILFWLKQIVDTIRSFLQRRYLVSRNTFLPSGITIRR